MPIFEYTCQGCGTRFEVLMREGVTPVCPTCKGEKVDKELSAFAVSVPGPKPSAMPSPGPCGGCANAGACGFQN